MDLYVLLTGDYSDEHIIGITDTLEKAEQFRDLHDAEEIHIEEYTLNDLEYNRRYVWIQMDKDGNVQHIRPVIPHDTSGVRCIVQVIDYHDMMDKYNNDEKVRVYYQQRQKEIGRSVTITMSAVPDVTEADIIKVAAEFRRAALVHFDLTGEKILLIQESKNNG